MIRYTVALFGWVCFVVSCLLSSGCASMPELPAEAPKAKELPAKAAVKAKLGSELSCAAYQACRAFDQCPPDAEADAACAPCPE